MSQNYEFTEKQNQEFNTLYNRLNYFTILTIIVSILFAINIYFFVTRLNQNVGTLPIALLFNITLGLLLRRPLDNIKNIINTKDKDISELMLVIDDFKHAFMFAAGVGIIHALILGWRTISLLFGWG